MGDRKKPQRSLDRFAPGEPFPELGRRIKQKLLFLINGETLLALGFLAAGIIVLREGFLALRTLWMQFAPLFPLSIPEYSSQRLLMMLPQAFSLFINVVSSLCAVLIGLLWAVSGLADALQSLKKPSGHTSWQDPGVVAEVVQTAQAQHWKSFSWLMRGIATRWPRIRAISPISYELLRILRRSSWKILFTGILIAVVFYLLRITPSLIYQYFQIKISFLVPSPRPLYFLLGLMLFIYGLTALSLFPFQKPKFNRTGQSLLVRGRGDPHLFLALLEEGCKLLSGRKSFHSPPSRLEQEGEPPERGTLIENCPEPVRSWANPAAYVYVPVIFMLLIMGFNRLIHFGRAVEPMPYAEFMKYHFLDYLLEAAFAIGLIIVGMRLAEMARKLFGVRKYRSVLVFCRITPSASADGPSEAHNSDRQEPSGGRKGLRWKSVEGTDDQFAGWVKEPARTGSFPVTLYWGEAVSASATSEGPRYLINVQTSPSLDAAMERILQIPFNVDFEFGSPAAVNGERESNAEKLP